MRKPVIAGNWKMYKLLAESVEMANELKGLVAAESHCEIVVAPAFTALKAVSGRLEGSNIRVAGQNCSTEVEHGARTGEICADMLADAGATAVIIGHSERRQYFGETDESVNLKTKAAISLGLESFVCVGETLDQRENGDAERVVAVQLQKGLEGLTVSDMERIIVAYEPVWAIGTGKTATPEQAQEMHAFIRRSLEGVHGSDVAERTRILYGGSVKPDNISDLMEKNDIDGALVGGASLDAESFARIVRYR
ncbi:MAG: triose-phosphate isomerase [Acidobacteriota bacterium]|nr:triose-phosphate isomerase [Acidobacteriota bacterium]MDH3530218.1 triose-phosphate isomerase [Acidobacteriota bacterium]